MNWLLPVGLLLFAACQSDKKDPLLEEAAQYHNEATKIQASLEPRMKQIDSLKTVLSARNTPDALTSIARLDSLKKAFEVWEENLVEVPGMPHDHHHDHAEGEHHHHSDATLKDLPPRQMRDLQQEALNSIRAIQTQTETAIRQAAP